MRLIFTLFSFLLLSFTAGAQKLTGIWRGYFSSSSGLYRDGVPEENYKYEIQLLQQSNNGLSGVTYSYKSTVFYGKAQLQGIVSFPSKTLIIKETRLLDLKIGDKSEPCLMTCYLDYSKMGKLETLEGTFISINIKDKGDCGSGKVYLERVTNSDFKKEDFLLKKIDTAKNKMVVVKPKPKPAAPFSGNQKPATKPPVTQPGSKDNQATKPVTQQKPSTVPKVTPPVIKKQDSKLIPKNNSAKLPPKATERVQEEPVNSKKEVVTTPLPPDIKKVPVPRVLIERENNLVQTITTGEEFIEINLYDNSIIDNDTISVYHNNQLVIGNGRLNLTPLTVKIKCSKAEPRHEIIVVAENLGDIPPNTALMVIKAGKERYEVFLASNEQRNAKVVINYVPKE